MEKLLLIPTYNERENIIRLLISIREEFRESDVLIIDDGSPDGTARAVRRDFEGDPSIYLLERESKQGLGSAYREGLRWGLARSYQCFFTMDADFSHPPSRLKELNQRLVEDDTDCVIGSRYVPGGGIENWGWFRRALSISANRVARLLIGLPVYDCTSGFRGYRRRIIEKINLDRVQSEGYVFLVEMVARVLWNGGRVEEVPFTFVDRRVGKSKINRSEIIHGFFRVLQLSLERMLRERVC